MEPVDRANEAGRQYKPWQAFAVGGTYLAAIAGTIAWEMSRRDPADRPSWWGLGAAAVAGACGGRLTPFGRSSPETTRVITSVLLAIGAVVIGFRPLRDAVDAIGLHALAALVGWFAVMTPRAMARAASGRLATDDQ